MSEAVNPTPNATRSAAVTAVAYATIVLGSIFAGVGAAVLVKFGPEVFTPVPADDLDARFRIAFILISYAAMFLFVDGLVLLLVAAGVLGRRRWGQVLMFVVAGVHLALFLPALPFSVSAPNQESANVPLFVVSLVAVVHATVGIVVLARRNAEFRKSQPSPS